MKQEFEIIYNVSRISRKAWADFVLGHPSGNVFQTPEMYDLYKLTPHHRPFVVAAVSKDSEALVGIVLADIVYNGPSLFIPLTARSIIIGGPLVAENDDKENILEQLVSAYVKRVPRYVVYSEIRPVYDIKPYSSVLIHTGFEFEGHYNLTLDLRPGKDQLWLDLHKERRRNIGQAMSKGLQFREIFREEEIRELIGLIQKTYHRKRVPLADIRLFQHARTSLGKECAFFSAYYDGKMIAGQVRLCYKDLVYAWFAGSDEEYFKLRPNDFLMWNVICWAFDNGYESFDFGGGGEPGIPYGVRDYKLKYGCRMDDFGRYKYLHRVVLYRLGKFGVKVLKLKK